MLRRISTALNSRVHEHVSALSHLFTVNTTLHLQRPASCEPPQSYLSALLCSTSGPTAITLHCFWDLWSALLTSQSRTLTYAPLSRAASHVASHALGFHLRASQHVGASFLRFELCSAGQLLAASTLRLSCPAFRAFPWALSALRHPCWWCRLQLWLPASRWPRRELVGFVPPYFA